MRDLKPISFFAAERDLLVKLDTAKNLWSGQYADFGDAFWEDVYRITLDFLSFSERGEGSVHLSTITNNACTKYHTDGYSLRLFTTYFGAGTEWLPERAVNRVGLGTSNEKIVKDPTLVQQMATY